MPLEITTTAVTLMENLRDLGNSLIFCSVSLISRCYTTDPDKRWEYCGLVERYSGCAPKEEPGAQNNKSALCIFFVLKISVLYLSLVVTSFFLSRVILRCNWLRRMHIVWSQCYIFKQGRKLEKLHHRPSNLSRCYCDKNTNISPNPQLWDISITITLRYWIITTSSATKHGTI